MKSKFTSQSTIFLTLISLFFSFNLSAQLRVGDPGVVFDQATINANSNCYPQMQRWSEAGVTGGIPFLNSFDVTNTISAGDSDDIIAAINAMANSISGNQKGLVILSNGNYTVDKQIDMKSNVSVAGQSRNGVVLNVYVEGAPAI